MILGTILNLILWVIYILLCIAGVVTLATFVTIPTIAIYLFLLERRDRK